MSLHDRPYIVIWLKVIALCLLTISVFSQSSSDRSWHDYQSIKRYDISNGLSQMKVSSIVQDSLGQVWVGTRNGLNKITASEVSTYSIHDGLPSNRILDLICSSNFDLMVLTSKGVSIYDGKTFSNYMFDFNEVQYKMVLHPKFGLIILSYSAVTIFKDEKFTSITGTFDMYNYSINDRGVLYSRSDQNETIKLDLNNHSYSINESHINYQPHYRYTGYYSLQCINQKCDSFSLHEGEENEVQLLVEENIIEIKSDELQDYLWTNAQLYPLANTTQFKPIQTEIISPKEVLVDKDGYLWLGGENGVEVLYNSPFQQIESTRKKNIWSVSKLPNGNKIGAHIEYTLSQSAFAVAYDKKRDLVITSNIGKVFIQKDEVIIDSISIEDGLHDHFYIQDIAVDSVGRYWLCSYGGVSCYDPNDRSITNYTESNLGIPIGPGIFSSYVDSSGTVWLGGENGLLFVEDDIIQKVEADALAIQVKGITSINKKHLLLATPKELIVFDKEKYQRSKKIDLTHLNDEHGYRGIEPGFTPFFRDGNLIYICSSSSVDVFHLNYFEPLSTQSNAIIQYVNDQALPFLHKDSIITIRDSKNALIQLSCIGHARSKNIQYKYKLDHDQWSSWQGSSILNLQGLSHGRHELKVRSGPGSNLVNDDTERIYLDINIPFYQRKNFPYVIGAVVSIFLLALCYQAVANYLKRRAFKKQVFELKYLRSHLLLSQMSPHFIFNVLASIQNKILFDSREIANAQLVSLSELIRNYLDVSYRGNTPNQSSEFEITLSKEIELLESYLNFEKSNSNSHFKYLIRVDPKVAPELELLPPMLVQPYVENAVKHGVLPAKPGKTINVHFFLEADHLICTVRDNGNGFDQNAKQTDPFKKSGSYGMKITEERISILNELGYNISIDIQSAMGSGTHITIKINNT